LGRIIYRLLYNSIHADARLSADDQSLLQKTV